MTTKYNQLVDNLVNNMKQSTDNIYSVSDNNSRKSFDELYEEFSSKSIEDQVTNIKQLGRQLVSQIDGIIDKLDVILEEDKKD